MRWIQLKWLFKRNQRDRKQSSNSIGKWPYLIMFIRTNIANQYRSAESSGIDIKVVSFFCKWRDENFQLSKESSARLNLISFVWTNALNMHAEVFWAKTFGRRERVRDDQKLVQHSRRALWLMSAWHCQQLKRRSKLKNNKRKGNLKGKFLTDN